MTDPECIINIYVILGKRNLFEMGTLQFDLLANSGEASPTFDHASSGLQLLWEGPFA